jgi:hypothetical protein
MDEGMLPAPNGGAATEESENGVQLDNADAVPDEVSAELPGEEIPDATPEAAAAVGDGETLLATAGETTGDGAPPEAAPPPTLPPDLADLGWTLAQDEDGWWLGLHEELGLQTDSHPAAADAIAQVGDLARALGAEVAVGDEGSGPGDQGSGSGEAVPASDGADDRASDTAPDVDTTLPPNPQSPPPDLPERTRLALTTNLLGVMYQVADERWQQVAPGEEAWTAVPFDYEHLVSVATRLLESPTLQEALGSLRT